MTPASSMRRASADAAWNRRLGSSWGRILRGGRVPRFGTVVEVGPGFGLKVGFGLREHRFRGTVFVVEPNARARAWIAGHYRRLLPSARVVPLGLPLGVAASRLPCPVDAVLMNHVLDDLILQATLAPRRRARVFARMQPGAPLLEEVRQAWRALGRDRRVLADVQRRVVDELCAFCAAVEPALVGISQYPSWFQARHGLAFVDLLAAPLLPRLARRLRDEGAIGPARLLCYGGKERRWLVGRRRAHAC